MSDQTHNIHTFMEGWKNDIPNLDLLSTMDGSGAIGALVSVWTFFASGASGGAFTPAECEAVIKTWPEYKAAMERLGGGE